MWAVDDRHRQASTAPHSTAPMDFAAVSLARSFACSQVFNYSLNHRLDFLLLRSPHSSIVKLPQEKLKKSTDQNTSALSLRKKEGKKRKKNYLNLQKASCWLHAVLSKTHQKLYQTASAPPKPFHGPFLSAELVRKETGTHSALRHLCKLQQHNRVPSCINETTWGRANYNRVGPFLWGWQLRRQKCLG